MIEKSIASLKVLLETRYDDLRNELQRRLGSRDAAEEGLHEAWLRFSALKGAGGIENPAAYIVRTAINVAADRERLSRRRMRLLDAEAQIVPESFAPDPELITIARAEARALRDALLELPALRREIFLMARLDGRSQKDIAAHFSISQRMVRKHIALAMLQCLDRIEKTAEKTSQPGAENRHLRKKPGDGG